MIITHFISWGAFQKLVMNNSYLQRKQWEIPHEQHKSCNKKNSTIENLFKLTQNITDKMRFQKSQKKL
jgi:hypothetical protein